MTMARFDDEFEESGMRRITRYAIPATILLLVAGSVWYFLHDTAGIRREAPPLPAITALLPPPPPPPPPKQEKPPEPEKKTVEAPKPNPTPKEESAPKPLTINGPAQAGNDAFNIGAGTGGGDVAAGTGFGNENYGRYLTSVIQSAVEQDDRVNHLAFTAQVTAWVDGSRHLHVKVVQSSGDPKVDDALVQLADSMPPLEEEPPGDLQFKLAIHSRRPG
jgi:outer membrane biosynthesis protein TonB